MFFAFVFLLLITIAFSFKRGSNKQVKIEGHKFCGAGYDGATNEFKFPIFNMQFNFSDESSKWVNPFYPGDDEFVPDQLVLTNTPESFDIEGVIVHHLLDNYTREHHYHYSSSSLFGKSSMDTYYYIHRLLAYDNSKAYNYRRIAWYTLELSPLVFFSPEKHLTEEFKTALSNLPKSHSSDSDKRAYRSFISSYGTHYIKKVVMGGELNVDTWLNSCFLDKQTISYVKKQSGWSFLGIISWSKVREQYIKKVDKSFLEHVEFHGTSKGGIYKNGTSWDEFKMTLKGNLIAPVYYDYDSIANLVKDQGTKMLLTQAIDLYKKDQDQVYDDWVTEISKEEKKPRPDWCDKL